MAELEFRTDPDEINLLTFIQKTIHSSKTGPMLRADYVYIF